MAKQKGRFRFVYRRSSPLLKAVVLATIILCTAALLVISSATKEAHRRMDMLRRQAATYEWSNEELQEQIGDLGSVKSVLRIAGEKLGLVSPDTRFYPKADIEKSN